MLKHCGSVSGPALMAAVLSAFPLVAFAETAPAEAPTASTAIQEVVVTAERFRSTVQTTPVAVTAFSKDTLVQRQINNVLDAASQIPGIVITPATGTSTATRIVLRGAGQENSGVLFDPAVGIYIDNVYQPRINGAFFDFFDLDHLEVLRGPQGTLYGRNTSGGAIKLETKRPTDDVSGAGDAVYGSFNTVSLRGYVSGPIVPGKVDGLISAYINRRDGITQDVNYGGAVNNKRNGGVRLKLLFTPFEKFEAEVTAFYLQDTSDPGIGVPVQVANQAVDPAAVPGRDLTRSELYGPENAKLFNRGVSVNAHYDVTSALRINSITGYGNLHGDQVDSFWLTALPPALPIGAGTIYKDHFVSQEFNATYTSDKLRGVAGVYYFSEVGNQYNLTPYSTGGALYNYTRYTETYAGFAQATYTILSRIGLTAGIRYTHENAKLDQIFPFNVKNALQQEGAKDFSAVTPKFGIDYQANANLLVYLSYTRGFKSGGFSSLSPSTNTGTLGIIAGPTPYSPERVTSYEGGVKFTTTDHRFRINAAVFDAEYTDLQLPVFFPGTSVSYTSNASGARIRGIELEPTWQPIDALQIYANASFQDGKYTAPFNCAIANTSVVDCSGNKIKGLAPEKAVLGFIFSPAIPTVPGAFHLRAEADYSDKYYNNVANSINLVQTPSNTLINASLAWDSPDGHFTVALEGKNLVDHRFILAGLQLSSPVKPTVTAYPNEPRIIDIRVRARF